MSEERQTLRERMKVGEGAPGEFTPVSLSLCAADFRYHSGGGDGCWLHLRKRTAAMFVTG